MKPADLQPNQNPELYSSKDMVSFGNYLLSSERRSLVANHPTMPDEFLGERMQTVSHADFANWKEKYSKEKIS